MIVWIAAFIFVFATAIWWLLIRTEGVYLGKGVVIWLYDLYASRYDGIVQIEDEDEQIHLIQPLLARIQPETQALILDVATGTGRMPIALSKHPVFDGAVIGLDASIKMLAKALEKTRAQGIEDTVSYIWGNGENLPFEDDSFDVVTCMEALEFMPNPEQSLHELVRVLRPDGLLLTTRRINEFMPSKLWSEEKMAKLLFEAGAVDISFEDWQYDYAKVWAYKRGNSDFIGAMPIEAIPSKGKLFLRDDGIYEFRN